MDTSSRSRAEGKRTTRPYEEDEEEEENGNEEEEEEEEEDDDDYLVSDMRFGEEGRKKRVVTDLYGKRGSNSRAGVPPSCQVDNCSSDLSVAKHYHRRHRVCEHHAKAHSVHIAGQLQRFCQQCSRFHQLSEFDDSKRSCRRRLAGHNQRRRKNAVDYHGE